ncbi:rod shape-determining protein MreD [Nonomuraea dietziae]|uniref:rod shape-determining protein MreD n=1 Tax=Nonomuraea dietziae TaxID=65515 RepID=UPI0033EB9A6A
MIAAIAVVAALLLQLTIVNRLSLPAGGVPDLVLLVVVGVALARGPAAGAVIGFGTGILVDLAPPTAHMLGQYAFVYTVVGYLAGRGVGGPVWTVVLCVLAAPLLAAAVAGLIADPRVASASLALSLPVTAVYSLLVAPVVVWLVAGDRARVIPA